MANSTPRGEQVGLATPVDPSGITHQSLVSKKDIALEALRGIAAITVLLWHSMLGFFPQWSGIFLDQWPKYDALNGQVWFGLIYGTAAVILFFVLSAFVLTRRFFETGNTQIILRGVIKRWPRLAGPVIFAVIFSWLLFKFNAYWFAEAGAITKSPWLQKFAYAYNMPFEPHFWSAFRQGAFLTFFRGDSYYDSSLWTMKFEFVGSFVAFGLALFISMLGKERKLIIIFMLIVVGFLCYFASPSYAAFPAGVGLALFLPQRGPKLPAWMVGGLIITAIYLFGFSGAKTGSFILAAWAFGWGSPTNAHIVASIMVIVAIELAPDTFRQRISGRTAQFLGALSFPLYLIHVLILCSLGSSLLILAGKWMGGPYPSIIACLATFFGSVLAAIPLMYFNEHWVVLVNRATNWLLRPSSSQSVSKSRPH